MRKVLILIITIALIGATSSPSQASGDNDCQGTIASLLEEFELPDELNELIAEIFEKCPEFVPNDPFCIVRDLENRCFPGNHNAAVTHAHASADITENEYDCTIEDIDLHVRAKLPYEYEWELTADGDTRDGTDIGPFLQEHGQDLNSAILEKGETLSLNASITNTEFPGDFAEGGFSYTCGSDSGGLLPDL